MPDLEMNFVDMDGLQASFANGAKEFTEMAGILDAMVTIVNDNALKGQAGAAFADFVKGLKSITSSAAEKFDTIHQELIQARSEMVDRDSKIKFN